MTTEYNIKSIYKTLTSYGIDENFVRNILLPEWWDDEIASSKVGYLQAISIIAKNLGADAADFIYATETITLKRSLGIKYKTAKNISFGDKDIWPQSLALRVSELIEQTYTNDITGLPNESLEIRSQIIERYNSITLNNVLEFLWSSGIPVLHVSEFPKSTKKMDGMAVNYKGRPIIILSKNRKHDAWLLFILAHELGHIVKGHINKLDSVIYDSDIEIEEQDNEEKEANNFALELLIGDSQPNIIKKEIKLAFELVNIARPIGNKLNIDPGIIILNYAYRQRKYALSEQALKILSPHADAISVVKSKMQEYLKLENLSEENRDYFVKLTSLPEE